MGNFFRRVYEGLHGRLFLEKETLEFEKLESLLLSLKSKMPVKINWRHYGYEYPTEEATPIGAASFIQKLNPEKGDLTNIVHEIYYGLGRRHYIGLSEGGERTGFSRMKIQLEF